MEIKYYVGIDIGHGETCASRLPGYNGETISRIPLCKGSHMENKKVISAICRKADGWGFVLSKEDYKRDDIRAGFKGRIDTMTEKDKESLREFVKLVFNSILENDSDLRYDEDTGEANFWVCFANPTGWRKDDPRVPDEYLKFLNKECGVHPARLCINESDAAYYTKHINYDREDIVLVIDLGSSTIDYTVFCLSGVENIVYNSGSCMGASRIEDEIVSYGYKFKSPIDNVKGMDKVSQARRAAGMDGDCEAILRLAARKAKEEFFTYDEDDYCLEVKENYFAPGLKGLTAAYYLKLNRDEMSELTSEYRANFKNELGNIAKDLQLKNIKPTNILLSGGASRMSFIEDITREIFPDTKLYCDSSPEWVVSDGAALYLKTHSAAIIARDNLRTKFQEWCDNSLDQCLRETGLAAFNDTLHETALEQIKERYYDTAHDGSLNEFKRIVTDVLKAVPVTTDFAKQAEKRFSKAVDEQLREKLQNIIFECYGKKDVEIDESFINTDGTFDNVFVHTNWLRGCISAAGHEAFNFFFEKKGNLKWDKARSSYDREKLVRVFAKHMKYDEFIHHEDLSVFPKEALAKVDKVLRENSLFAVSDIAYCDN